LRALVDGLSARPRSTPSKFLYDAEGSRLFERICKLPEYYPTRTETALLSGHADDLRELMGPECRLVEFGCGSSEKVRLLLDAADSPAIYVGIDISGVALEALKKQLGRHHPEVAVEMLLADFTRPLTLPPRFFASRGRAIGFFPGSNIGNFTPPEAAIFLRRMATGLGPGSDLIVGVDLKKDKRILEAAYNDQAGVTAAFNLNLLVRANRELGATFDPDAFSHRAIYREEEGRIEMHLFSDRAQTVEVNGHRFHFAAGESIHTENSCKYSIDEFQAMAAEAGWRPRHAWVDDDRLFSLHYLSAPVAQTSR